MAEDDSFAYVARGIAEEVAEALKGQGAAYGPVPFKGTAVLLYVPWAAKRLFDHLVSAEERVTLFLHALVSDVVVSCRTSLPSAFIRKISKWLMPPDRLLAKTICLPSGETSGRWLLLVSWVIRIWSDPSAFIT